jgi:hypothetical protein
MKYYALFYPGCWITGVTTELNKENMEDYHIEISEQEFNSYDDWQDDMEKHKEVIARQQYKINYYLEPSEGFHV